MLVGNPPPLVKHYYNTFYVYIPIENFYIYLTKNVYIHCSSELRISEGVLYYKLVGTVTDKHEFVITIFGKQKINRIGWFMIAVNSL